MENNISERISVGSRQTSITRTSQYSKHLAIETQSQSSESSRTSGYGSFTNGSVPNGHQISVASQSQYLLDGQDTDLIQSKGLVTSQVSRVSFSHLILSTTIHYPNLLFYWAYILKISQKSTMYLYEHSIYATNGLKSKHPQTQLIYCVS